MQIRYGAAAFLWTSDIDSRTSRRGPETGACLPQEPACVRHRIPQEMGARSASTARLVKLVCATTFMPGRLPVAAGSLAVLMRTLACYKDTGTNYQQP